MATTKTHPGAFRCYEAALPDEPMFVLLGRDPAAPATVRAWCRARTHEAKDSTPEDRERIDAAMREAGDMERWRAANRNPHGDGVATWRLPRNPAVLDDGPPVRVERPGVSFVFGRRDAAETTIRVDDCLPITLAELVDFYREHQTPPPPPAPAKHWWSPGGDEEHIEVTPLSFTRMSELLDYATCYGEFDENTPNGTISKYGPGMSSPMNDRRRSAIWTYKRCMGIVGDNDTLPPGLLVAEDPPVAESPDQDDWLLQRLHYAIAGLRDGRLPTPHDLYRAVKKLDDHGWSYQCVGLGVDDLERLYERLTKPGTPLNVKMNIVMPKPPVAESPLTSKTRFLNKDRYDRWIKEGNKPDGLHGYLADDGVTAIYPDVSPVVDSEPDDLAHAPEVPPHRFSQFIKAERYAYARGLEVSPSHLPTALDAMAKDGWHLLAIFGQTDKQNVGFIFQRGVPSGFEMAHGLGGVWNSIESRLDEPEAMSRYRKGHPLDDILSDEPLANPNDIGYGRGLEA